MSFTEKINRHFNSLKFAYAYYKKLKNNPSTISWKKSYEANLKQFNNIHDGEDCIIVGNGPSLNKMDLTMLKDYHTFGMNKIHLYDKCNLNLSYLAAVNPLVIEQAKDIFEQSKIPVFLSLDNASCIKDGITNILKIDSKPAFGFGTDIAGALYEGGTVTSIALQLAWAMGFKRIALIGVDHNFKQQGQANAEQLMEKEDENHFHPDYFKGQQWHLADLPANEISYSIANYYAKRYQREIYDCTVDGKLNIFEKKNFYEVISTFKKK